VEFNVPEYLAGICSAASQQVLHRLVQRGRWGWLVARHPRVLGLEEADLQTEAQASWLPAGGSDVAGAEPGWVSVVHCAGPAGKQRVYPLCSLFLLIALGDKSLRYLMEALTRGLERAGVHNRLILMGVL